MTTIGKLLGMPEAQRSYEEHIRLALRKCLTGLEFEAENVKNHLPHEEEAGWWTEKKDDSLRGNSMEYVLREPLFGKDLINAVEWLCNWATKEHLESNYRTGLHVHIDVRNMNTNQLLSMLIYYSLFEKVIYSWVGDNREGSIFCMPFYKAEGVLEEIVRALRANERMRDYAKEIKRYAGLNLNSLSRFGTVEWRHMQTTFDSERVIKWINVAQGFKRYALANALQPKELLAELSKMGPDRIFAGIVGPSLAGELWTKESEGHVWTVGIPAAQEIATLLDGSAGLAWDNVRTALGEGSNPRWTKWAEKEKERKKSDKLPENPFSEPELLHDQEVQKAVVKDLGEAIREELEKFTIPVNEL